MDSIRSSFREIIVYSRSTINMYFPLSHEWWVILIKFMMESTIHVRWGVHIYGTLEVLVGPTIHVRGKNTHL